MILALRIACPRRAPGRRVAPPARRSAVRAAGRAAGDRRPAQYAARGRGRRTGGAIAAGAIAAGEAGGGGGI